MSEQEYFNVADIFGENVFNDAVMQERLPKKVYKKLHEKERSLISRLLMLSHTR